ncbi:rod shape-determining protein RodA [Limibacter armeniacum]|uniref:rod shape-determining protein RodA n=1 Tax=Limibacter armeniacum TaxID=466084 RepID=UPI002FE63434
MRTRNSSILKNVDWTLIFVYFTIVILGWLNIYAAVYQPDAPTSIFSLDLNSGKQLLWIAGATLLIISIMVIDYKFFDTFAYIIFGAVIVSLIGVLLIGHSAGGNTSWFKLGFIRIQPSEFAKFAVSLAIAKYLSDSSLKVERPNVYLSVLGIIAIPAVLVLAQKDTGSAMVFAAFVFPLYREGFPAIYMVIGLTAVILFILALIFPWAQLAIGISALSVIVAIRFRKNIRSVILVLLIGLTGIGFTKSIDVILNDVMRPHQRKRIEVLINPDADPLGVGYQVTQSKIAIGSGGFAGKGFLEGTQTKFNFVPEQSTDFIFCTVGEEHGWIGSLIVMGLFLTLIVRLIWVAERQRSRMSRVYGYSVASIFFLHFMINIGMTIGVFPVIGIPLPFFSYGGSSLWSFTILLFVFIKLDAHRMHVLVR